MDHPKYITLTPITLDNGLDHTIIEFTYDDKANKITTNSQRAEYIVLEILNLDTQQAKEFARFAGYIYYICNNWIYSLPDPSCTLRSERDQPPRKYVNLDKLVGMNHGVLQFEPKRDSNEDIDYSHLPILHHYEKLFLMYKLSKTNVTLDELKMVMPDLFSPPKTNFDYSKDHDQICINDLTSIACVVDQQLPPSENKQSPPTCTPGSANIDTPFPAIQMLLQSAEVVKQKVDAKETNSEVAKNALQIQQQNPQTGAKRNSLKASLGNEIKQARRKSLKQVSSLLTPRKRSSIANESSNISSDDMVRLREMFKKLGEINLSSG